MKIHKRAKLMKSSADYNPLPSDPGWIQQRGVGLRRVMGERKKNSSLWNVPYVKEKTAEEKVADSNGLLLKQQFSRKSHLCTFPRLQMPLSPDMLASRSHEAMVLSAQIIPHSSQTFLILQKWTDVWTKLRLLQF